MLSALLLAAAVPAAPACPIDKAVYRLKGDSKFTAGFARQDRRDSGVSDLVLWLNTPKRTYWFAFGAPNGYGGTYLNPELDPRISVRLSDDEERDAAERMQPAEPLNLEFDAFRPDLTAFQAPPRSGDRPPALLFARGLGPALWYGPSTLAGNDSAAEQEGMPIGLFVAAGCGGPPKARK
ncbi:MAG TPA: hypothetical protein VFR28_11295 [Allosphingosinicella sp.]|jgi:hypothetical protein|nr:hypothetical protein [Allosphingosinicella sp.]